VTGDGRGAAAGRHAPGDGDRPGGVDAEAILELMVRHGSLEFAFQFGQGVAAAYESFHEAFAGAPPSPHRAFVEALIPYMLARSA
jgi:hypothetical protein